MSSSVESRVRRWGAIGCVLAAAIGVTGCTAQPDAKPRTTGSPVSETADPAEQLGPTEQPELPVVEGAIDEEIELDTGMTVVLSSVSTTAVEAETPGDVAGDAVVVEVEVTNASPETQSVESAVVTLETADGEVGVPTIAGGAEPLSGEVAPEASARGRYLFMLDPVHDRDITISVNYAAGEPLAQFTGRTPAN